MQMQTKSCEIDILPMTFIKKHLNKFIRIIRKIVNISLQECIFSDHWKTAILRPLITKIVLNILHSNYRRVSNLNFILKVMDSAMLEQVKMHCKSDYLNPNYQLAYRSYHSCGTALIKIINDILWNMENKQVTTCKCRFLILFDINFSV